MGIEHKYVNGSVTSTNETPLEYKGIKVGVIKGYIATWDRDAGNDRFHKGAFKKSLEQWKAQGRDVKLKDMHGNSIGVFPIDMVHEDDTGLFGVGYINLDIQQGQEAHSKAKMGIYDKLSVGFSADPKSTKGQFPIGREIYESHLWEGSLVDEPMNIKADILSVKSNQGASVMLDEILGTEEDIKDMSIREIERSLKSAGASKEQAKTLISHIKSLVKTDVETEQKAAAEQKSISELFESLNKLNVD